MQLTSLLPETIELSQTKSLLEMFQWQVQKKPNDICIVSSDNDLTFAELYDSAAKLAAQIVKEATPNTLCVGVYADPSIDLLVGVWGAIFSGKAYLPLAPEYPEERIRYIIENSETDVIVTQSHLLEKISNYAPTGTRFIIIDEGNESSDVYISSANESDLAYVIYTSGSTGRPKGVMIENHAITSQLKWLENRGYVTSGTRILQKTPMSFDAAQWEILAPAMGGVTVTGVFGLYRDPDALMQLIKEQKVTALQCVPTLLQALIDTEKFHECTSLTTIYSGGEALSQKLAKAFYDYMPNCRLVNLYGPTECTINATFHEVTSVDTQHSSKSVTIGKPVFGTTCYVLDKDLRLVETGETGELYIGGIQVARGYLNRPNQTLERFIYNPENKNERIYKTGDLVKKTPDGNLQFCGRIDHQVKLRGYRVELAEVALAIESHQWVRCGAAIITDDERTNSQSLTACIELSERKAALMDQGVAGKHHQSKANKHQVKAQLSNGGLRDPDLDQGKKIIPLGYAKETAEQRRIAFGRKTYRFYDGDDVTVKSIIDLLSEYHSDIEAAHNNTIIDAAFLSKTLRWFGQFKSENRLLPKYAYASPGALYATQIYIECKDIDDIENGIFYFHPIDHKFIKISNSISSNPGVRIHFTGKTAAIESVYKNNILEVLEMETGHMLGLFQNVLAKDGYGICPIGHCEKMRTHLNIQDDDYYLGTFEIVPVAQNWCPNVDLYLQAHGDKVEGMPKGTYKINGTKLNLISEKIIKKNQVIAINQQTYENSSLGISVISREKESWLEYIALGHVLHRFQSNTKNFGFMSSGYSSKTGNPLRPATRITDILGNHNLPTGASYFFIGGKITDEQYESEGMNEDRVHMQGPAEMITEDLAKSLPDYMIPNRVVIFDKLPQTANGKVDLFAIKSSDRLREALQGQPYIAPETPTEIWLADLWKAMLKYNDVSKEDDFFTSGGNSLTAVSIISKINKHFNIKLPIQIVFEHPRLTDLAARIDDNSPKEYSRLVQLNNGNNGRPIFCWPGLGGYPMNLRPLAQNLSKPRPFFGVQSYGINQDEVPFSTISEMAKADVKEILKMQSEGPYTLWGYSFGARVAFETAWQLEQLNKQVDQVVLICPGNPRVRTFHGEVTNRTTDLSNKTYLAILLSVFTAKIDTEEVEACYKYCSDHKSFIEFILERRPEMDAPTAVRIMNIVRQTYEFEYSFKELTERQIVAPITIIKAKGDDYSFIEGQKDFSFIPPEIITSDTDHYEILKLGSVEALISILEGSTVYGPHQFKMALNNIKLQFMQKGSYASH